jgi:DnaJ-class molecular chaperone
MTYRDYYKDLGVERIAYGIRRRFSLLSNHPDKNSGDKSAEERSRPSARQMKFSVIRETKV